MDSATLAASIALMKKIPKGDPGDPTELIDDTAGEGDTDKVWSADKSHSLLTAITNCTNAVFSGEKNLLNADVWTAKTNGAIANNCDGTYTFGTNDYGSVFWESDGNVPAGKYTIPGSPYGYTVVATSQSYTENIVAKNETGNDMEFTNPTEQKLYFCIRTNSAPSASFTFAPAIMAKESKSEEIEDELRSVTGEVAEYFISEMSDTVAKVRKEITEPSLVFPWITDIHRLKAPVQTFGNMIRNLKCISNKCAIDFIVDSGDTIEGDVKQDASLTHAYKSIEELKSIGVPLMYVNGNHDNNPYYYGMHTFNLKQIFSGFFSATKGVSFNKSENGTDYYFDHANLGVRVIVLNSCNVTKQNNYGFGDSTSSWLENVLDTEYFVILVSHVSPIKQHVWNNIEPANGSSIKSALTTFADNGGKLIVLTGHSHVDAEFIDPFIEVTNVCQKFEQADTSTQEYQGYLM